MGREPLTTMCAPPQDAAFKCHYWSIRVIPNGSVRSVDHLITILNDIFPNTEILNIGQNCVKICVTPALTFTTMEQRLHAWYDYLMFEC